MESLAFVVIVILVTIYGSGFIALAASWFRNDIAALTSKTLGTVAIVSGLWLGFILRDWNGLFLGSIPVLLGSFAIWNSQRRKRATSNVS